MTDRGKRDAELAAGAAEEGVGHLQQNARAITGAGVAPWSAGVEKMIEDLEAFAHNIVRFRSLDIRNKSDPATILFKSGVIKSLLGR